MSVNFQDEDEVKEYVENIGVEYRFGCYSEKKPEGMNDYHAIDIMLCEMSMSLNDLFDGRT